jgi:Cu/Ag efflux pump CusA
MLRAERGELVAYVYVDLEEGTELLDYVERAQHTLGRTLASGEVRPERGERIEWTGQYELLAAGQQRLRPKLMTITTMAAGLFPLLWADGAGAEIMRRVAAPMLGGLLTSAFLTPEVLPVLYVIWRYRQLRRAQRSGTTLATIVGPPPAWARR